MNDQRITDEQLDQLEDDLQERFEGRWILLGRAGIGAGEEIVGAERVGSAPSLTQHASSPRELLNAIAQREQQLAGGGVPHGVGVSQGVVNTRDVPPLRPSRKIIDSEREAI